MIAKPARSKNATDPTIIPASAPSDIIDDVVGVGVGVGSGSTTVTTATRFTTVESVVMMSLVAKTPDGVSEDVTVGIMDDDIVKSGVKPDETKRDIKAGS